MTDVSADTPTTENKKVALGRNYWTLWSASVISNIGDGTLTVLMAGKYTVRARRHTSGKKE